MADRRRRRTRASQDSEDDDESGSGSDSGRSGSPSTKARARDPEPAEVTAAREEPKAGVESECESEDEAGEAVLSDYDSADPEENASHSEGAEEEEEGFSEEEAPAVAAEPEAAAADDPAQEEQPEEEPGEEEKAQDGGGGGEEEEEGKGEEKNNAAGERQSGDGQESTEDPETKAGGKPGQHLDDDEDRKNPAYIPRKGLFFEHDVRGHAQEEERPKGRHRKLWKDEGRWEHDRFREEEQAPKSRQELIAIYGYDIRNGAGAGAQRAYRQRRPRPAVSPSRDKRWRDDGERPARSWSGGRGLSRGGGAPPPAAPSPAAFPPLSAAPPRAPPPTQPGAAGGAGPAGRGPAGGGGGARTSRAPPPRPPPRRASPPAAVAPPPREASPGGERPVERKSYSLARRTRSRASDLGSKQPSLEEGASSPAAGGKSWAGAGDGASQPAAAPAGGGGGARGGGRRQGGGRRPRGGALGDLDQDVARLSLARQNWSQSPTSYMRSEMRGLPNPVHLPGAPPQFSSMEELGGSSRAKRYSSQRQRPPPEPTAPPLHLPVMEGHFYETVPYQGPIYTHGDGPAPIPPQSMLVQPEMHLPHPGIHPHQSGAPIASPALYGGPPVSLSPGQPQQLLPPPFYPPPGVMTFPYPAMYPTPQAQAQVTYGGVTYYDTVQQQAQPKPSPPRRTSQPVSVKPPPAGGALRLGVTPPHPPPPPPEPPPARPPIGGSARSGRPGGTRRRPAAWSSSSARRAGPGGRGFSPPLPWKRARTKSWKRGLETVWGRWLHLYFLLSFEV
ncbi:protein CASC3 [Menidia menidia]